MDIIFIVIRTKSEDVLVMQIEKLENKTQKAS